LSDEGQKMASEKKVCAFRKNTQRSILASCANALLNQKGRWKNNILVKVRSATSNNNEVNPSIQFNL